MNYIRKFAILSAFCLGGVWKVHGFSPLSQPYVSSPAEKQMHLKAKGPPNSSPTSSYEDTDAASQGLVSTLTNLVNAVSTRNKHSGSTGDKGKPVGPKEKCPPTSVEELSARIRDDYTENNYLWTGKLDLACFDMACKFADPTLSFQGTDTFQRNTENLVPLVERFVENDQSILLEIRTTPDYVETRWNMIGELNSLFWRPKIDVIGQTKFWFQSDGTYFRVYDYDEKWEIPAYQALLQLVTPAGTFPNSK